MKIGISERLFLAILAAAALAVTAMFGIMQWSIDRGFLRYVNNLEQVQLAMIAGELEADFAREGSWAFMKNDRGYWRRVLMTTLPTLECAPQGELEPPPCPMPGQNCSVEGRRGGPPAPGGRHFAMRLLVLDDHKESLIGPKTTPANTMLLPLHHQGKVIGHLGLLPLHDLSETHELRFLKEQKLTLGLVGLAVVLAAAGLALPLAGRLVRPIQMLTLAVRKIAAGEFATRVPVSSPDELGQLGRDFNLLALTLERNEQTRRQWVADISHELRTPLAVLRAEIEALQDGVRPTSQEAIRSLHGEVIRLNRLVDDLYQLSLSDLGALSYRKEQVDLTALIDDAMALYRHKFSAKGIRLDLTADASAHIMTFGDPERLQQLIANLLDNSLKYTDSGGALSISLTAGQDLAVLDLQDSAPGVEETKLDRLFERLYRVESSRSREAGGAGLGLAICKNIVEAHAGTITARASNLGGVWIQVTLPLGGAT